MDNENVSEVFRDHRDVHIDEYETDSVDEETENEEHLQLVKTACITRPGRAGRSFLCLDL